MTSLTLALLLALAAAGLHALWNIVLKSTGDPLLVAARALTSSALLAAVPALVGWWLTGHHAPTENVWVLVIISSILELGYFVALSTAYGRGELSLVYPVARGTAALLAVPTGVLLLRERLNPLEIAAILCLLAGIVLVRGTSIRPSNALLPALLTGCFIAAYQAVDRVGVRLVEPWLYGWLIWVGLSLLLLGWIYIRPRSARGDSAAAQTSWRTSVAVGIFMSTAYLLVLIAYRLAPLSIVAPVRESAIVLVTGWGVWRLREGGAARLLAGGVIVAGIALLTIA